MLKIRSEFQRVGAVFAVFMLSVQPVNAAELDSLQVKEPLLTVRDSGPNLNVPVILDRSRFNELSPRALLLADLAEADDDVNDPLEPVNRAVFAFNEVLMDVLLRPAVETYNEVLPTTMRQGISNFLKNLATPIILANDILQLEPERAMMTISRFVVNSTVGIFGFADVSTESGDMGHTEDFGQTLGVWGVGEGFYLVLPVIGPSNPRDAIGRLLVDPVFDVTSQAMFNNGQDRLAYAKMATTGFVSLAGVIDELDQIKHTSIDYYAAIRSLYRQKRKAEISNGSEVDLPPIPELSYDLEPEDLQQSIAGTDEN